MRLITCALQTGLLLAYVATAHAERRLEPTGDLNPTVVSVHLMKEIAAGKWQLGRFVEPARGIVVVHYEDYDSSPHLDKRARHYCGEELAAQLPALQKKLASALADMECYNRPQPICIAPGEESKPQIKYYFANTPRGVVLETVSLISWNATTEKFKRQALRFVQDAQSRVAAESCSR